MTTLSRDPSLVLPVKVALAVAAVLGFRWVLWRRGRPASVSPVVQGRFILNESVFQLSDDSSEGLDIDVVLFHGLQRGDYPNAWHTTWQSREGELWPILALSDWLQQDRSIRARILSVSYDAGASRRPGRQGETDLRTAAEALLGALQLAGVGQRPLYLVGHSLGCLLIKRLCLEADRTGRVGLLQHLRSLFFLAPPFAGSRVADLARALGAVTHPSAMLLNSTTLNEYTARQNADFALLQANLRFSWRLIGYSEMHDTTQGFLSVRVVPEASVINAGLHEHLPARGDHFTIAAPTDPNNAVHILHLRNAIADDFQPDPGLRRLRDALVAEQARVQRTLENVLDPEANLETIKRSLGELSALAQIPAHAATLFSYPGLAEKVVQLGTEISDYAIKLYAVRAVLGMLRYDETRFEDRAVIFRHLFREVGQGNRLLNLGWEPSPLIPGLDSPGYKTLDRVLRQLLFELNNCLS